MRPGVQEKVRQIRRNYELYAAEGGGLNSLGTSQRMKRRDDVEYCVRGLVGRNKPQVPSHTCKEGRRGRPSGVSGS